MIHSRWAECSQTGNVSVSITGREYQRNPTLRATYTNMLKIHPVPLKDSLEDEERAYCGGASCRGAYQQGRFLFVQYGKEHILLDIKDIPSPVALNVLNAEQAQPFGRPHTEIKTARSPESLALGGKDSGWWVSWAGRYPWRQEG